jgi:diaminopimelate decarboxylase
MSALEQVLPPSASVSREGHLVVGGCDLVELAQEHGTPLVVYDEGLLRDTMRAYRRELTSRHAESEVLYASKAYFGQAMLRLAEREGLSVDVASGGELHAALHAGIPPHRIYMHGNNKDAREVGELLEAGVGTVIVDGFDEIALLSAMADEWGARQRVLVRVAPGIEPDTHRYIATGQVDSKFGFPLADDLAKQAVEAVRRAPGLELIGLHAHIGSQLLGLEGYASAAAVLADFAAEIGGDDIGVVDMGGGLGIAYTRDQRPPSVAEYAEAVAGGVRREWERVGLPMPRLLVEPGRSIVGRAGLTVYRVGGVKRIPNVRTYVAVDGGMSDLLRPMLYGATYESLLANRAGEASNGTVRVVGKHCESGDVLVREAHLPETRVGDLVCLPATGAYGVAMASNYNGSTRPAVVFVDGGECRVVTRRETYDDLIARDL